MGMVSSLFGNPVRGQEVTVYCEMADGTMWSGKAVCAELTVETFPSSYITTPMSWTLSLVGSGELTFTADCRERIKEETRQPEWYCSFCGAVMPKTERKCEGCGAWHSFVYDLWGNRSGQKGPSSLE